MRRHRPLCTLDFCGLASACSLGYYNDPEAIMRALPTLLTALVTLGFANNASADQKIRLAQTSAVTTCMMTCNSAFANCNSSCVATGTLPQGTLTTNLNAGAGNLFATGSCTSSCTNQQLSCQINCARTAPSH